MQEPLCIILQGLGGNTCTDTISITQVLRFSIGVLVRTRNIFQMSTSDLPESNSLSRTRTFGALTYGSDVITFMDAIV